MTPHIFQTASDISKMSRAPRQKSGAICPPPRPVARVPPAICRMTRGFSPMSGTFLTKAKVPARLARRALGKTPGFLQNPREIARIHHKPAMAIITTNTSRLPVREKCFRGASIITLSTDNPRVPGNADAVTTFAALQDDLVATNENVDTARAKLAELLSTRDAAEKRWDCGIAQLASLTEALTEGDPTSIISAGFGTRTTTGRPQPLPAPTGLRAATNGSPGKTMLSWDVVGGVVIYLIEMSLDPDSPVTWKFKATSTRTSRELDGAHPGQPAWFRIAAVNATGQGPWSTPAQRPVM